jgi:hypothetical protein
MHGVMDGIVAQLFGPFGQIKFTGTGTALGFRTHLQILFGAGSEDFAEQFGKFGGVFGFFKGVTFVGFGDFGIAFTLGLTAHGQIHTHFAALALKVGFQTGDDFRIDTLGRGHDVFTGITLITGNRFEFSRGGFALGAEFGGGIAFVDVTTDTTYKFHDLFSLLMIFVRENNNFPVHRIK